MDCGEVMAVMSQCAPPARGAGASGQRVFDRGIHAHSPIDVYIAAIASLRPFSHGDYTVVLKSGEELRLSRRYASPLLG